MLLLQVLLSAAAVLLLRCLSLSQMLLTLRPEYRPGNRAGQPCQADRLAGTERGRDLPQGKQPSQYMGCPMAQRQKGIWASCCIPVSSDTLLIADQAVGRLGPACVATSLRDSG